jgi:hypothetical protein
MSNTTGRGSYTNFFTSIPASDVAVRGLPSGSAGSRAPLNPALSSTPALFAISPDLAHLFTAPATRKLMPARPATHAMAPSLERLAA